MFKADLHIHSNYSDGLFSPEEIFRLAANSGLEAISITDHDCVNALKISKKLSKKFEIEFIPGIEFSTAFKGREVHMLGYFIDYNSNIIIDFLKSISIKRIERVEKIIDRLKKVNIKISLDNVLNGEKKDISIGRPHIAKALIEAGYVKTYRNAFFKYLGDNKIAFVKKENPDLKEIIEIIKSINGLSFLAHPGKYYNKEMLKNIIKSGIDGIEVHHPSHRIQDAKNYVQLAEENNLLMSGGSDFHGLTKSEIKNFGKYYIDVSYISKMKSKLKGSFTYA
jgi:predicted metal-dependent phosphoesterase TrpH